MPYPYVLSDAEPGPLTLAELLSRREDWRRQGRVLVTTNGCFDLLHVGHLHLLREARAQGDVLLVGLNSDRSVTALKGPGRPLVPEAQRAALLQALRPVDYVLLFDDLTANDWLGAVRPDVHCKGSEYRADELPEAGVIRAGGGRIHLISQQAGSSTSLLMQALAAEGEHPAAAEEASSGLVSALLARGNHLRQTALFVADGASAATELLQAVAREGGRRWVLCAEGPMGAPRPPVLMSEGGSAPAEGGEPRAGDLLIVLGATDSASLGSVLAAARQRGVRTLAVVSAALRECAAEADAALALPPAAPEVLAFTLGALLGTLMPAVCGGSP